LHHIKNEEISLALYEVLAQEGLHAVSYNRLVEELNIEEELNSIYNSSEIMKKRTEFLKGDPDDFEKSLAISTLFGENGSLFVSFFLMGELTRTTGKLAGLNDVNFYSLKDEFQLPHSHYRLGLELMKVLGLKKKDLKEKYLDEFLKLEDEFIMSIPGITDTVRVELKKYLRWRVRHNSRDLSKCPEMMQPFETLIRSSEQGNFFERKVTSYTNNGYLNDIEDWLNETNSL
jgi:ribonucleotide reductase beta subunit family protein with ferritin-like domain